MKIRENGIRTRFGVFLEAFLLIILLAHPIFAADDVSRIFQDAVRGFASAAGRPMVVSVGNFTYADKGIGSAFSVWVQERLGSAASATPGFELFDRDKLDQILKTAELNLSDLFDQERAPQIGNLKAVQGIFSGRFFDEGSAVRLSVELLSVEKGTVLRMAEALIPKASIPPTVSLLPDNYNDALFVLKELSEVANARNTGFVVKAWTDRGEGGTYREGEELSIRFYANRDCFIKLYHVAADGTMKLIFPNQYHGDNRVPGKRLYTIPDSSYPFKFVITRPLGSEFVKAIASTIQFKDIEEAFTSMGAASGKTISRGLDVAARPEQLTEALVGYTIVGATTR